MAIVTDPDDLDRYQVIYNPDDERISVKGLGTVVTTEKNDGELHGTNGLLSSPTATFQSDGVAPGDIVAVITTSAARHYVVSTVDSETALNFTSNPDNSVSATSVTFRVQDELPVDGPQGGNVGDGVTMQALYSFSKEEWRTLSDSNFSDLIQFTFPIESITREQFEIGGPTHSDWDFFDDDTRNLIRTGGWAQIDSGGTTQARYTGVVTLGAIDTDAQVYYIQSALDTPTDFVSTGPVNQAVLVFTAGGSDLRDFLKLFVRKKARTYPDTEIADIGVTQLETIVNRFPLTHANDPAITAREGDLGAAIPYQLVSLVSNHFSGDITALTDDTFHLSEEGADFSAAGLIEGDIVNISVADNAVNSGQFEIMSVIGTSTLRLFTEPGTTPITETGSDVSFSTFAQSRKLQALDGGIFDIDSATGGFSAAGATFTTSNGPTDGIVQPGDILLLTSESTGGTSQHIGAYFVVSVSGATNLTINTIDQGFPAASQGDDWTYQVMKPGMRLQFFSTTATEVTGTNLTFNDDNPDTISRATGSFITDGFVSGMALSVSGSTNNDGTYIATSVAALTITLADVSGVTDEASAAGRSLSGVVGITRLLNNVAYPFRARMNGNNGTLLQCFQWIQRELRRGRAGNGDGTTDIDDGQDDAPLRRGDIVDPLMTFASPTGTGLNMFIDSLAAADSNNATFQDFTGIGRNFAFIAAVTINLNTNLTDDSSAKVTVFFTSAGPSPGNRFGSVSAIIVQDVDSNDMSSQTTLENPMQFQYDYDNNVQGGRTAATDAEITIVAIGLETAQYVQTTGTIQRQDNNIFSLVAALERNFSNP